ncbi:MAG: ribosome assembly factor SBDS [Candidatus Woesearchaeota archaeon]
MVGITYDPEKFQLSIIRYKRNGLTFEVVIDPQKYTEYYAGKLSAVDILISQDIFHSAQKGELASKVQEVFSSTNDALQEIIQKGEVHLTAKFKKELRDQKFKQIIDKIVSQSIDPRTSLPIPRARLDIALEKIRIKVDEFKPVEDQIQPVFAQLREQLPIKLAHHIIQVRVPVQYGGKIRPIAQKYGTLEKEEYLSNGTYMCRIKVPSGLVQTCTQKIDGISQHEAEFELHLQE